MDLAAIALGVVVGAVFAAKLVALGLVLFGRLFISWLSKAL